MTAVQRSHRMTVEEAWLARQSAASAVDGPPVLPGEPSGPAPTDSVSSGTEHRSAPPRPVIDPSVRGADAAPPQPGEPGVPAPRAAPSRADLSPPMTGASEPSTASRPAARSGPPITMPGPRPEVRPPARPRIEPEPAILGLSRHTRSRLGSRLFNLFFVFVFVLILVQMVVVLLSP